MFEKSAHLSRRLGLVIQPNEKDHFSWDDDSKEQLIVLRIQTHCPSDPLEQL